MHRRRLWLLVVTLAALVAVFATVAGSASAKVQRMPKSPRAQALAMMNTGHHKVKGVMHHGRVTPAQREAAAARLQALLAKTSAASRSGKGISPTTPDYFMNPNWNISPPFQKFVDPLPDIPTATPDKVTFPGSDYYIIGVVDYSWDVGTLAGYGNSTAVRGYVQLSQNAAGAYSMVGTPKYLGPAIVAQRGTPVRVKFVNLLGANTAGNLMIPVDTTTMGAGMGPLGDTGGVYPQNRADIHLHGGDTAWISDGTPNQWITPTTTAGTAWANTSAYKSGVSVNNVPDMMFNPTTHVAVGLKGSVAALAVPGATTDSGPGSSTYFYTNNESARLLFYHDHSFGITRLNVYAGEAAAYLLQDTQETSLTANNALPADQIPLVVQDKGFVDSSTIASLDPTWGPLGFSTQMGALWYPHVYMPNQNPGDLSGANAYGRWDYGPWFWPIFGTAAGLVHGPVANPFFGAPGEPALAPGTPNPSMVPEYFADTMLVNGVAYPVKAVSPKPYRLRILNASNERFLNLQLYTAADGNGGAGVTTTATASASVDASGTVHVTLTRAGSGFKEAPGAWLSPDPTDPTHSGGGAMLETSITAGGAVASVTVTSQGSGWIVGSHPLVTIGSDKEVLMTEACPDGTGWNGTPFPTNWPTDGRDGGVPDPATAGPAWQQVGTEGGFLPKVADIPIQPVNYVYNRRDIVVLNISTHSLLIGPAERADVVIDFTKYAGKTVILYNDAPAPVPAFDPRNDLYTGGPDMRDMGGSQSVLVGQGPNTRTVMAFKVAAAPAPSSWSRAQLDSRLPAAYQASQPAPIVPQVSQGYPAAYAGTNATDIYSRIQDNYLDFIPLGSALPIHKYMEPKAIQELFELDYGRMNATLGVELPFTNAGNQTTIPLGYLDPETEVIKGSDLATPVGSTNDGTQIWKITHNGVDTHIIHWHLYNVQLINRVGWDGAIRPPDNNEIGWKESVRMNPLEDAIVALRPVEPVLPFKIGDSIRPLDPTMPLGATLTVTDPADGNQIQVTNVNTNFGWEYVWHCHLLGHEENDMMRPVSLQFSPAAPSGLTATAATTPLRVNLSWTGNAVANPVTSNYRIQRATNNSFTANVTEYTVTGAPPATTYSDTAVVSGTTYYYRVRAENVSAYSDWSNTASATPVGGTPPLAPTNLRLTGRTTTSIGVAWNNATGSGATSNLLQISSTSATGPWTTRATLSATSTSYLFSGLTSGRTYWIRVVASNAFGQTPSNVLQTSTL